jgi:hypothetical protein
VALPLGPTFPPVDLFTRLLAPGASTQAVAKGVRKAAQGVCDALLEGVLRAAEGAAACGVSPRTLRMQPQVCHQPPLLLRWRSTHTRGCRAADPPAGV